MIKVNQDQCIGCGLCVGLCPEVFQINTEGKAEVVAQTNLDCAKTAAASCPVQVIEA